MSSSYPFFSIAREYGVPYPEVLKIAEVWERGNLGLDPYAAVNGTAVVKAVGQALRVERSRRAHVEWEEGYIKNSKLMAGLLHLD